MKSTVALLSAAFALAGCFTDPIDVGSDPDETGGASNPQTTGEADSSSSEASTEGDDWTATSTSDGSSTTSPASTTSSENTDTGTDADATSTGPEPLTVCPVFYDDFERAEIDARWLLIDPTSLSQEGGEAVITVTAALNDQFARFQVLPESNGLRDATARIELGTTPAVEGVRMVLWVQAFSGNGRIAFSLAHRGAEIRLEARITPEDGPPSVVDTAPWDPETMRWLQLRESAGVLYFEVSPDGMAFEEVFQMPTPIDVDNVYVGFVGHNDLALAEDAVVSVRTFELICGGETP